MNTRRLLIVAMLVVLTTTAAAIELRGVRRNRTRPCLNSGIPIADYQYEDRSSSASAISKTPLEDDILLEQTTVPDATESSNVEIEQLPAPPAKSDQIADPDTKLFQWNRANLVIDYCSISMPALRISRNGDWTLSLRADQNPKSETNEYNPTLHIKRNKFVIKLRCYGSYETLPSETSSKVGRPILAELPVKEFWVENGQPKYVRMTGSSKNASQNFDLIDRVEIEFFYVK